jgi:hypothetical protein
MTRAAHVSTWLVYADGVREHINDLAAARTSLRRMIRNTNQPQETS